MASTEFATRSNKSAVFLFLLGFGLVAAGGAFAFAPQYSWQVTKIARLVSGYGLHNGALVVGGLVVVGLAVVARAASAPAPTTDSRGELESLQSELHLFNEQVSTKLAQLRTALLQLQENVTAVVVQQQAQMQAQMQDDSQKSSAGDHSQDAVFRLAASLDKLHAHLDERVHAVDLQLRSGFETLLNVSHDMRRHLEQGGFVGAPAHASQPQQGHGHAGGPEAGIDFFETMQKLDAIAGGDGGHVSQTPNRGGRQPQAPFPNQGQSESLDALLPEEYRDRY